MRTFHVGVSGSGSGSGLGLGLGLGLGFGFWVSIGSASGREYMVGSMSCVNVYLWSSVHVLFL